MATNPEGLLQTVEVVHHMLTQLKFQREDLEQLLLRLDESTTTHCNIPSSSLQTVNDYIIVTEISPRSTEESNDTKGRSFLQEHVSGTDPENPKLQYLFDIESQRAAMRWCSLRNLFTLLLQQMSVRNPTAATRILLGRSNVAARYVGDSLLITRWAHVQSWS
ncbi:hypothetical protein Tcan_15734 [Toxocara canis]|uniref:Uncharacterized protein n=1 Tax=Toxocara canis TaxID=6265 RepID=A0A0B2VM13_TOXCA|nr:hypothetical protein Tcan_15734 [Toxocara canis]